MARKGGVEMKIEDVNLDTKERGSDHVRVAIDWESPNFDVPSFSRMPPIGSKRWNEMLLLSISHRIEWLASRRLKPHPTVLARRAELIELLGLSGPEIFTTGSDTT